MLLLKKLDDVMKMKNILAIGIVFIVLCTMSMVCAAEINNPEGFTVNEGLTVNKETGDFNGVKNEFTRIVLEKGTDNITVTDILPSKSLDLAPCGNSVMKNISSKQGIYEEKDGRCIFEYLANGTIVEINAPNEKLIEEVIGK